MPISFPKLLELAVRRSQEAQEASNNYLSEIPDTRDNLSIVQQARLNKIEEEVSKAKLFLGSLNKLTDLIAETDQGKIILYLPDLDPVQYQITWGKDNTMLGKLNDFTG